MGYGAAIDTLKASEDLQSAGMDVVLSKAVVGVLNEAVTSNVATKDDLAVLKADMEAEFADVRGEMRTEFAKVRQEMAQNNQTIVRTLITTIGFFAVFMGAASVFGDAIAKALAFGG